MLLSDYNILSAHLIENSVFYITEGVENRLCQFDPFKCVVYIRTYIADLTIDPIPFEITGSVNKKYIRCYKQNNELIGCVSVLPVAPLQYKFDVSISNTCSLRNVIYLTPSNVPEFCKVTQAQTIIEKAIRFTHELPDLLEHNFLLQMILSK